MTVPAAMNDFVMDSISKQAATIREQLRGGCIYGVPIDENNADMMIVATYLAAQLDLLDIKNE